MVRARQPQGPTVRVTLSEPTLALLIARRKHEDESLDVIVARLAAGRATCPAPAAEAAESKPVAKRKAPAREIRETGKYRLELLGETIFADRLGDLFAGFVDLLASLDPSAVERLATMCARKRAYVSRRRQEIHPGRPDLQTLKTRSGWWISQNIGQVDLERALRAACFATGLVYGRDVAFEAVRGSR